MLYTTGNMLLVEKLMNLASCEPGIILFQKVVPTSVFNIQTLWNLISLKS